MIPKILVDILILNFICPSKVEYVRVEGAFSLFKDKLNLNG